MRTALGGDGIWNAKLRRKEAVMYGKDGRWYHVRRRSVGRKLEVYRYIQAYIDDNGYPPTLQEIADEVHVTKPTAQSYLRALEEAGLIRRSGPGSGMIMIVAMDDFGKVLC